MTSRSYEYSRQASSQRIHLFRFLRAFLNLLVVSCSPQYFPYLPHHLGVFCQLGIGGVLLCVVCMILRRTAVCVCVEVQFLEFLYTYLHVCIALVPAGESYCSDFNISSSFPEVCKFKFLVDWK